MTVTKTENHLPLSGIRVAAIVTNPCSPDPRVMKQAESVAKAGAEVTIFCAHRDDLPTTETINGVNYKRLSNLHSIFQIFSSAKIHIFFSSLKENWLRTILLLIASSCIIILKALSLIFQKIKKFFSINNDNVRPSFIYGPKSIFRPLLHASYVFLRGDMYKCIYSDAIIDYKPDIIHAHDFITVPTALYCAKKTGAKVIFDAHEIEADRVGSNGSYSVAIIKKDLKHYLPKVDALISVNESALNFYLENYNFSDIPEAIIYNTPATQNKNGEENDTDVIDLRSKLAIKKHETLFVYTGSIGISRGVPEIVEAMMPVENTHLCIMGPQKDSILDPFIEHVKSLNMEERIHIVAPVAHQAVTETVKSADAGIMFTLPTCLNHIYCLPNKLFESAMAGLPIVGADLPEIKRFIEEEKIGLLAKAGDISQLSNAIREMAKNPLLFRPDEERLEQLKEKWSWDAQEKKLIPFYQEVLGRKGESD